MSGWDCGGKFSTGQVNGIMMAWQQMNAPSIAIIKLGKEFGWGERGAPNLKPL